MHCENIPSWWTRASEQASERERERRKKRPNDSTFHIKWQWWPEPTHQPLPKSSQNISVWLSDRGTQWQHESLHTCNAIMCDIILNELLLFAKMNFVRVQIFSISLFYLFFFSSSRPKDEQRISILQVECRMERTLFAFFQVLFCCCFQRNFPFLEYYRWV